MVFCVSSDFLSQQLGRVQKDSQGCYQVWRACQERQDQLLFPYLFSWAPSIATVRPYTIWRYSTSYSTWAVYGMSIEFPILDSLQFSLTITHTPPPPKPWMTLHWFCLPSHIIFFLQFHNSQLFSLELHNAQPKRSPSHILQSCS